MYPYQVSTFISESIYEWRDDVLSHQKQGDKHRIVICHRPPPHEVGEWVSKNEVASCGKYSATWDENIGFEGNIVLPSDVEP